MSNSEQTVAISPNDLKDIISTAVATAIQESRKPVVTEAEERELAMRQEQRAEQAKQVRDEIEQTKWEQKTCTHERSKKEFGGSTCVHIRNGNYMLCQRCRVKIYPGNAPAGYKGLDVYSTDLFNRIFQDVA
jgi:RNA polymerase-binding transcription factor DksA